MTLTPNTPTPVRLRRLLRATLCPAVAFAVMVLTAPAAQALTEQQIQNNCKSVGGTYYTAVYSDGTRGSQCCYKSKAGITHCDYYENGNYIGTSGNEPGTPTATEQPVQPPPGTAPAAPGAPPMGPRPVQTAPTTAAPIP